MQKTLLKPVALEKKRPHFQKGTTKLTVIPDRNVHVLPASLQKTRVKTRVKTVGADRQKEEAEGEYYVKSCPRYTAA